jgi:hypothetical protein
MRRPFLSPERLALPAIILILAVALLAGLKPPDRDLIYQPLALMLLAAMSFYQLVLRPGTATFALAVLLTLPGLFVYLHYYSALALLPAIKLTAKLVLAAGFHRALDLLIGELPTQGNALKLRLAAALALPPLTVYLLLDLSILLLTALALTGAVFAAYCGKVKKHD